MSPKFYKNLFMVFGALAFCSAMHLRAQSWKTIDPSYLSCERALVLFNQANPHKETRYAYDSLYAEFSRGLDAEERNLLQNLGASEEVLNQNNLLAALKEIVDDGVDFEDLIDQFPDTSVRLGFALRALQESSYIVLEDGRRLTPNEFIIDQWNQWKMPEEISSELSRRSNDRFRYSGQAIRRIVERHLSMARDFSRLRDRRHPDHGWVIENGSAHRDLFRRLQLQYGDENFAFALGMPTSQITHIGDRFLLAPETAWKSLEPMQQSLIDSIVALFKKEGVLYHFREQMPDEGFLPFSRNYLFEQFPDTNVLWLALKHRAKESGMEISLLRVQIEKPSKAVRQWRQLESARIVASLLMQGKPWNEILDMKRSELGFDPRAFLGNAPFTRADASYAQRIFDSPYEAILAVKHEVSRQRGNFSLSELHSLRPPTREYFEALAAEMTSSIFRYFNQFGRLPSIFELNAHYGTHFSRWRDRELTEENLAPVKLRELVMHSLVNSDLQRVWIQDLSRVEDFQVQLRNLNRLSANWLEPTAYERERLDRFRAESIQIIEALLSHFQETGRLMTTTEISNATRKAWVQIIGSDHTYGVFNGYEDLLQQFESYAKQNGSLTPDQLERLQQIIHAKIARSQAVRQGRMQNQTQPALIP